MNIAEFISILGFALFTSGNIFGQTCCSGGVPVSANLGLPPADMSTLQIGVSYDWNILRTLKSGGSTLSDDSRDRETNSLIIELGYSLSDRFSVDLLTSHVRQSRTIFSNIGIDQDITNGFGDLVILGKYQLIKTLNHSLTIGVGPKLPTGSSDLKDAQGLALVADLQPGSGALDWITWGQINTSINSRPSMSASITFVHSFKGKNEDYLSVQTYQFGDETQLSFGLADQFIFGKTIFEPSLLLRYRNAKEDEVDRFILPNTGGDWIFISPAIAIPITQTMRFSISTELPLLTEVTGTQLSPTMRWNIGWYTQLSTSSNQLIQ